MNHQPDITTFLAHITAQLDGDDMVAIGLTGSYARGEATPYSDIDIYRFSQHAPEDAYDRYHLEVIEGHLVSITKVIIADRHRQLAEPDSAIWAVPGLRQMHILLDKKGELAALKQEAERFQWQPLQPAADFYASTELAGFAEEAHKVLSGLAKNDDATLLYGTHGLLHGLTRILLVQRGQLLETENSFFAKAQQAVGVQSDWSKHFRIAAGFDTLPEQNSAIRLRAVASLRLYVETAQLLRVIIKPEHSQVVETTIELIHAAIPETKELS